MLDSGLEVVAFARAPSAEKGVLPILQVRVEGGKRRRPALCGRLRGRGLHARWHRGKIPVAAASWGLEKDRAASRLLVELTRGAKRGIVGSEGARARLWPCIILRGGRRRAAALGVSDRVGNGWRRR